MSLSIKDESVKSEQGSVLIVVVVVLLFVSMAFSLGIGRLATDDTQDKIQITSKRQQFLISQLAAYAQRENKVPCPADASVNPATAAFGFAANPKNPNLWKTDPNQAGSCGTSAYGGATEGMIPFRTLGLEAYDALDGWGRPMTYRMSPVLNDPAAGTLPTNISVFMRCRRFPWFSDGVNAYPTNGSPYYNTTNIYPEKAMFCCPPDGSGDFGIAKNTDLKVYNKSGGTILNGIGRTGGSTYANINTITPTGYDQVPLTQTEEIFAFAIISHGKNGVGAFMPGTTGKEGVSGTQYTTANAGTDEIVNFNATKSQIVVDHPMVLAPGANYFDDMVVWRTQIQLMGELGSVSCYQPWR